MDHTRDPCPWVALNDFGGAFCMGVCAVPPDVVFTSSQPMDNAGVSDLGLLCP